MLSTTCLLILVAVLLQPSSVNGSATNCDYRPSFLAYSTGAAGSYAQCMTVKGKGLYVSKIKSYFIAYTWLNTGSVIPIPIPSFKNICKTKIQWKYKLYRWSRYTYTSKSYGCSRPTAAHQVHRNWKKGRYGLKLSDRSKACMRWKSELSNNKYTAWTCTTIMK